MKTLRAVAVCAVVAVLLPAGLALADDTKPAAVQVCISLPVGVPLFAKGATPKYRALPDGSYVLDLDVTLNGQAPQRLTRSGVDCVRAWVKAEPIRTLTVSGDRLAMNLVPVVRAVSLNLKPDLWHDAGQVSLEQQPFSQIRSNVPGTLTLARQLPGGTFDAPLVNLDQVPVGVYSVKLDLPPSMTRCSATLRMATLGTIRADNKKPLVDELSEHYLQNYVPEVLRDLKMTCHPGEAVQVEMTMIDGIFVSPRNPKLSKVKVPGKAPRYALEVDGVRRAFDLGQLLAIHPGEHITLEAALETTVASTVGP